MFVNEDQIVISCDDGNVFKYQYEEVPQLRAPELFTPAGSHQEYSSQDMIIEEEDEDEKKGLRKKREFKPF